LSSNNERLDELEYKIEKLHELVVDPRRTHVNHVILDYNLSRHEVNKIFGLLDELSSRGGKIEVPEFESMIYDEISRLRGDNVFVNSLIRTLEEDGKYPDFFKNLQR